MRTSNEAAAEAYVTLALGSYVNESYPARMAMLANVYASLAVADAIRDLIDAMDTAHEGA